MKTSKFTTALATISAVALLSARCRAEESSFNSIQTALSSTTISGYVDTSLEWTHTSPTVSEPINQVSIGTANIYGQIDTGLSSFLLGEVGQIGQNPVPWSLGNSIEAVPEPSAFTFLVLGMLALFATKAIRGDRKVGKRSL